MGKSIKKFFRLLGPGLTTGIADNDPSGIATTSQTGAQFGYGQLWSAFFMLPMLIAIQEASARIGAVKGKGIAAVIRDHYGKAVLYPLVLLTLIANTINIGANIGAMAAAAQLIMPINFTFVILVITAIILILQIFIPYKKYANILKWLSLSFILYPLSLMVIDAPWETLLKATFIPTIQFDFQFLFILTALFGTTISPYMFFWEASQEVEEEHINHIIHNGKPHIHKKYMKKIRWDNFIGMFFSQICTWSIIVVTGTVLNKQGITNIQTAADAAKALEPFVQSFPHSGYIAKLIFALGIIGLGFLSIPILSSSASYAVSETFQWRKGLNLKFKNAYGFYGVICIATLIGLSMDLFGIDPIKALVYSAALNGIVAIPIIFLIALIANNKKMMGRYKSSFLSNFFVWITFAGMAASAIAMFLTW